MSNNQSFYLKPEEDKVLTVEYSIYDEETYYDKDTELVEKEPIRDGEWDSSLDKIFEYFDIQDPEDFVYLLADGIKDLVWEHYFNAINFFCLGSYEEVEIDNKSLEKVVEEVTMYINEFILKFEKEQYENAKLEVDNVHI